MQADRQIVYQNTYRTEPQEVCAFEVRGVLCGLNAAVAAATDHRHAHHPLLQAARFQAHRVQRVLRDLLHERLAGQAYDPVQMSQATKRLAGVWVGVWRQPPAVGGGCIVA